MNPKRLGLDVVRVHFGMFDFAMVAVFGKREAAQKFIRWKLDWNDFELPDTLGYFAAHGDRVPCIWMPRRPRTPREHGTLSHEIMHVVGHMFVTHFGMPLAAESSEAYSHAIGYAVTRCLE